MVHDMSWATILVGCVGVNVGVWIGRRLFGPPHNLDFNTIWYLSLGYLIAASMFKWGW
jgi:hypothetical protein